MADYQLTNSAERAIDTIYEYSILTFGLEQAKAYVQGLHACFSTLADSPGLGRDVSEMKAGYRRHVYERHAVYYNITKTGILITRILGPGQDPAKHLL